MTEKEPLVSIVIPVYNGANYLKQAIGSALSQTYKNCEVIVVNDGSNDNGETEKEALRFGDNIRYFKKSNGGVASALNFAIGKMRGEYFSWLSHDDLYMPEKIEMEVDAVLKSGDPATLVQAEYVFYDQDTKVRTATNFLNYYTAEQITNSCFSVLWLQHHACSALIHKSHFDRVGLFDESLTTIQDIDMWFRIFRNQKSVFLPNILHMVRVHRESGCNTMISRHFEEERKEYGKLVAQMEDDEIERVFGNTGTFLCRMAGFVKTFDGLEELKQIEDRISTLPAKKEEQEGLSLFWDKLLEFSGGKKKKIIIFGAGQYGIRLKYDLESRLVRPECFMDNSKEKQGKMIDGIPCISKEQMLAQKGEVLVIIALRNYEDAVEELRESQVPYYVIRQQLDPIFLGTGPALSKKELWLGK